MVVSILLIVFLVRLVFLKKSIRNERAILADGGCEYGVENTKRLTVLHILFYVLCLIESIIYRVHLDSLGVLGLALLIFSMLMLYLVTQLLGDIWTVKLMLLKNHRFVDHWLFRVVKHPNYFLNIVPELIGLGLLCHARWTCILILPLYAIVLFIRIKEEEKLLRDIIIPNSL
ncbi:isoprenylcysteine carboxyl methyltransferase (ICMT) family protein YpbQ [Streptococcus rupicaprae]|uniref:Isoprenylcysteine carboxyl methyltransferase (ICMT) family protein YpbQ n=1 Tax=Streptococcus rupicaprae TaxID=759619 RepID=A0ABV2FF98_9STRE